MAAAKENEMLKQRKSMLEWKQNLNVESKLTTSENKTSNHLLETKEVDREQHVTTERASTGVEDAPKPVRSALLYPK